MAVSKKKAKNTLWYIKLIIHLMPTNYYVNNNKYCLIY